MPNPALLTFPVVPHVDVVQNPYYAEVMADDPAVYLALDDASYPPKVEGSGGHVVSPASSYPAPGGPGVGAGDSAATFTGTVGVGIRVNKSWKETNWTAEALFRADTINTTVFGGSTSRWPYITVNSNLGFDLATNRFAQTILRTVTGVVTLGQVHHLAVVKSGTGSPDVYLDGVDLGGLSGSGALDYLTAGDFVIGTRDVGSFTLPFDGQIGGVAIHSQALSEERILAHAQAAGLA